MNDRLLLKLFIIFLFSYNWHLAAYAEPADSPSVQESLTQLQQVEKKADKSQAEPDIQLALKDIRETIQRHPECYKKISDVNIPECERLVKYANSLKAELLEKLNRYSVNRLKNKSHGILYSQTSLTQIEKWEELITVSHLLVTAISLLGFSIVWLGMRKLHAWQTKSKSPVNWLYPVALLLSLLCQIGFWLADFELKLGITSYWYVALIAALFYSATVNHFRFRTLIKSLAIFCLSLLTTPLFLKAGGTLESQLPLIVDTLVVLLWSIAIYVSMGKMNRSLQAGLSILFITLLLFDSFGYHQLAHQVILSLATIRIFWLVAKLVMASLPPLVKITYQWLSRFTEQVTAQQACMLPGIDWLTWGLNLGLITSFFIVLLTPLGIPEYYSERFTDSLLNGFNLGSISIAVWPLILSTIVFGSLLTLAKLFQYRIETKLPFAQGAGGSEAVAAIFWYSAVLTASLIALSIAGFRVENLALVAGAFSIGIGFGLQNIVSNFVSGLILLIERPIKRGDWVVIGTTEGFVKKVNIRATEIQTFDRADIIVPNSDLLTNQVTNWMLNDSVGRVRISVGVAYGSNISLVKDLLTKAALTCDLIIKDEEQYQPQVLFMAFGESSLDFEIRAFLKNVANIIQARSEINFTIDALFNEHGVTIPFPQRDLHIRSDETKGNQQ